MQRGKRLRERLRTLLAAKDGVHESSTGMKSVIVFEGGDEAEYTSGEYIRQVEDACEHYDTSLLVPVDDEWAWLWQDEGMPEWVETVNREVSPEPLIILSPYRYRYLDTTLREGDPHLDAEGWSRAPS